MTIKTLRKITKTSVQTHSRERITKLRWKLPAFLFFLSFVGTSALIIADKPSGMIEHEFAVGEPAPRTLFSPFEIQYINEKATAALREDRAQGVPPILSFEPDVMKDSGGKFDRIFSSLLEMQKAEAEGKAAEAPALPIHLSESARRTLQDQTALEDGRKSLELLVERIFSQGILDTEKKNALRKGGVAQITLLAQDGKSEKMLPLADVPGIEEARAQAAMSLPAEVQKNKDLRSAVLEIFNETIQPNLDIDDVRTAARRKKTAAAVDPVTEKVKKDELIVQRGVIITPEEKLRLTQIQKKLAEHKVINQFVAVSMLVFLAYLLCFLYLVIFERKTLASLRRVALIQTVIFTSVVLCKIAAVWPGSSIYLMPTALASALLVLLVTPRLGFVAAVMMSVFTAPLAGFNADFILAGLLASVSVTFAALQVRKRIQFLRLGAAAGLTFFLVLFAFRLFQEYTFMESFLSSAPALANGLLITYPLCLILVWFFETVFNMTTDITLLELSDLNHPLLKRMIVEAPGTYHHSLVVSTLAESACEAVGANALLARVGCYFHDIGKIPRAEFFTENQANKNASRHDKMTPGMSSTIILNHVKDGIELGKQYKLKEPILRFIPEHQGTGVIYFFYRKALDQAKPGEKISPDDYRYPGPKPQSRETAVALLSDSVEAASRSLKDPTPESIRQLVRKIINDKFIDGQLDECDLTLRDLHKIQNSFVHNLMAIFHTRVSYPQTPQSAERIDLFGDDCFPKPPSDPALKRPVE